MPWESSREMWSCPSTESPCAKRGTLRWRCSSGAPGDELHMEIQHGAERMSKAVVLVDRQNDSSQLEDLANYEAALVRQLGILAVTVDEKVLDVLPNLRRTSGVAVAAVPAEYAGLNPGLVAGDVIHS